MAPVVQFTVNYIPKIGCFAGMSKKIYGKLELKKFGFHAGLKLKRQLKSLQCIRALETNLFGFNSLAEKSISMNLISWIYLHVLSSTFLFRFTEFTHIFYNPQIFHQFHVVSIYFVFDENTRKTIFKQQETHN